jgi:hypothetical protein
MKIAYFENDILNSQLLKSFNHVTKCRHYVNCIYKIPICNDFPLFQRNISTLLPVFESFLADAPDSASFDAVRQSVVILMGSLAKHLDKDDPKVKPIMAKLIETLSTPSQPVCRFNCDI